MRFNRIAALTASLAAFTALTLTPNARSAGVYDMANRADLIVVGTVSSRTESPTSLSFDIYPERAIKGQLSSGVIHIVQSGARAGIWTIFPKYGEIQSNFRGIWCLEKTSTGAWEALNAEGGPNGAIGSLFWPAAPNLPSAYSSVAVTTPLDDLGLQVAAASEASGFGPEQMIGATGPANTPALQAVFAHFLTLPSPKFRSAALAGMLWGGQTGAVSQVASVWPVLSLDPSGSQVVAALRNGYRSTTPGDVQQLAELASAGAAQGEMRQAAIWALSNIHTKEALPFLAGLLSSADPAEQARGVFGLGAFANGCPVQTTANLRSMEYLQFKNPSP